MNHRILILILAVCAAASGLAVSNGVAQTETPQPAVDSALRIDELVDRTNRRPSDGTAWTELGILYINENMLPDARNAFISALQAAPQEPASHLNLAVCLLKMEKWEDAQGPLQSYRAMMAKDVRGWSLGGAAFAQAGDTDSALKTWLDGVKVADMPAKDRTLLVTQATGLLLHMDDEDEPTESELFRAGAILDAQQTLIDVPDGQELRVRQDFTWLELASRQQDQGATDQALKSWAHLRETGSDNHAAWLLPIQVLLDEGRIEEARALASQANSTLPDSAIAYYLDGRVANAQGDFAGAARSYTKAAAADPDLTGVWPALGEARAKAGDSHGASEALAEAVKRGQGGSAAAYNMGVVLSQKNQYREAIPYLVDATHADPTNRDAFRALGTAYRKEDRYKDAQAAYQTILDQFGPDPRDLYQLAFCEAKNGDHARAAAHYEMVTAMDPQNVNAFYALGNAQSKVGKQDEAIAAYKAALGLQPDNHGASFGWALALQKKGDYEGAIERYEFTLEMRETYSSYVNIAICYANLGDQETSDEYYALANELKKKGR